MPARSMCRGAAPVPARKNKKPRRFLYRRGLLLFISSYRRTQSRTSSNPKIPIQTMGEHRGRSLYFIRVPSHAFSIPISRTALTTSVAVGMVASSRGLLNGTGTSIAPKRAMGASM